MNLHKILQRSICQFYRLLALVGILFAVSAHAQTPGYIYTVAGEGPMNAGYSGDGGPATSAQIYTPVQIAIDSVGNFYFAEPGNNVIRRVDHSSGYISTVAGNGSAGSSTVGQLNNPEGIALANDTTLYIADTNNSRIAKVDLNTGTTIQVAGAAYPGRLLMLDSNTLLYSSGFDNEVHAVNLSTGALTVFAGDGINGFAGDGGPATSAELNYPVGMALFNGDVYIADYTNYRVRKVDHLTGNISTVAGNGTNSHSGDGGTATAAGVFDPTSLTFDAGGNLYIGEEGGCYVRKVLQLNQAISTIAGNGSCSHSGDAIVATSASIFVINDIAMDTTTSDNSILLSEGGSYIRKIYDVYTPGATGPMYRPTTYADNSCSTSLTSDNCNPPSNYPTSNPTGPYNGSGATVYAAEDYEYETGTYVGVQTTGDVTWSGFPNHVDTKALTLSIPYTVNVSGDTSTGGVLFYTYVTVNGTTTFHYLNDGGVSGSGTLTFTVPAGVNLNTISVEIVGFTNGDNGESNPEDSVDGSANVDIYIQ